MKFALLGWSPLVLPVLKAISASAHDALIAAAEIPDSEVPELTQMQPGVRLLESWEALLAELEADVCLVAGASEAVLDGARHFAGDRRSLALLPMAAQGTAFVYELTLSRDDHGTPLIPLPHLPLHDLSQRLKSCIAGKDLGDVILFRLERQVPASDPAATGHLTVPQIDDALLTDVALLRTLGGDYSRVTAVRSTGPSQQTISLATVTLSGDSLAEATWTARAGEPAWKLELTGTAGTAELKLNPELTVGTLTLQRTGDDSPPEVITSDGTGLGAAQLESIQRAPDAHAASWAEMTRSMETVEATHTSIRRRRTIDLFFETTSERSIFKSQMTAAGCGLLLLTLFLLVGFLALGAMLDSRSLVQRAAEADGRIVTAGEFLPESDRFSKSGEAHLRELSRRMARAPEPVFVMPDDDPSAADLDQRRLQAVVDYFVQAGQPESALYVEVAEQTHPATLLLLTVLKYLWIAPLLVFLALQSLIGLARPSHEAGHESTGAELPDPTSRNQNGSPEDRRHSSDSDAT